MFKYMITLLICILHGDIVNTINTSYNTIKMQENLYKFN